MIENFSIVFYIASIVLYLTAFGIFLSRFTSDKDTSLLGNKFLIAGLVTLTIALVLRFLSASQVFSFRPYEIFAVISWFLVLEALIVEFWSGIKILGFYISPFAASMLLFGWSQYRSPASLTEPILKNNWVLTHANLVFIAYGAFIIGAGSAILYLVQERQIKNRKSTKLMRYLPSLNILEETSFKSVTIGFTVLTIALGIGISFALGHPEGWDAPMVGASIFAWFVFLFYIYSRVKLGWLGRKSAYVIIFGLVVILIIHFGVAAFLVTAHRYTVG
jgi:ABC-type uncharacterized transport system permease subunit